MRSGSSRAQPTELLCINGLWEHFSKSEKVGAGESSTLSLGWTKWKSSTKCAVTFLCRFPALTRISGSKQCHVQLIDQRLTAARSSKDHVASVQDV